MKLLFALFIFPILGTCEELATLCPVSLTNETAALFGDEPQYVRGPSGAIYKACWSRYSFQNSGTHTNISVQTLAEIAPQITTLGKSVAISGIADLSAFMDAMEITRCDAQGTDFGLGLETLGETQ